MADRNVLITNSSDIEVTAINFGTGDAGTFEDAEAGVEYRIWNDKGKVLDSSDMTSVKMTVRDSDGQEVENVTVQKWCEIKSLTIHEGADIGNGAGDASGVSNDDMADFQPIGKEGYLNLGDIPANCYRKIRLRINIPTSALESGKTFKIYVTNQQPSSPIAKWITGLWGDGVVNIGDKLEVTAYDLGNDTKVDIAAGWALINDIEVYLSKAQTYTISDTNATYKIYLTRTGVISSTTGVIPSNSIILATVVIAGNVTSSVTDERTFMGGYTKSTQVGITAFATGGQGSAIAITAEFAEISVCATEGDSVKLPAAVKGLQVVIFNHGATAVNVFPATGDIINSRGADNAKPLAENATMLCYAWNSTNWECMTVIGASER